jgi:hypothetical protein
LRIDERYGDLLLTWCDGLRAHQLSGTATGGGGLLCPACQVIHGRSADAVYPLLAAFARTGREEYRQSALDLLAWSDAHATLPDGSWRNEPTGWPWRGITCFSVIALGEALRVYGHLLDDADADRCRLSARLYDRRHRQHQLPALDGGVAGFRMGGSRR